MEFTGDMIDRIDEMDNAIYQMCLVFLQLSNTDDLDSKFPWNIAIIQEIYDFTVEILRRNGYRVCDPCIESSGNGSRRFCEIKECGFSECKRHP
ncbi:hypothetical protein [Clostridium sp. C105KSO13]|uniref:hypothetical protein n=1 Tax=Clostridium sp. C105KSO13 TaxID=1776045 RepID=UPI0007406F8D|nr:hypothetical protein [Clostridium sp. C105KSO13]CUX24299.1 hypothetical protein BN3456_00725 [Clostridium sp. C105KSO13]